VYAGTRFRPLSLNVPKPLFPLAGQPMVHHPISACRRVRPLPSLLLCSAFAPRFSRVRGLINPRFGSQLPQIPNLAQIYLIGFYEEREFALYVSSISNELRIPVRSPSFQFTFKFMSLQDLAASRFGLR
jgi:mannose-1-phosphate guanylyltransferase